MKRFATFATVAMLIAAAVIAVNHTGTSKAANGGTTQTIKKLTIANPFIDVSAMPGRTIAPAIVTGATYKGVKLDSSQFLAADDWFKDLKLQVKNVSDRTINAITMTIEFEPSPMMGDVWTTIEFGKGQARVSDATADYTPPALALAPGETTDVDISGWRPNRFNEFKAHLGTEKHHGMTIADIKAAVTYIIETDFTDGQIWAMGWQKKPDPEHPGAYKTALALPRAGDAQMIKAVAKTNALKPVTTCYDAEGGLDWWPCWPSGWCDGTYPITACPGPGEDGYQDCEFLEQACPYTTSTGWRRKKICPTCKLYPLHSTNCNCTVQDYWIIDVLFTCTGGS